MKEARKDIETSYLSYRNELTPKNVFVTKQATSHRLFWVGSWSFLKKFNDVPSLQIHKATRPSTFLSVSHS